MKFSPLAMILIVVSLVSAQTTWSTSVSGTTVTLSAIASNSSIAVAVGDSGTILTSTDGTNWSPAVSNTTVKLNGIVYGGTLFVAVGDSGTVLTSPNGTDWTVAHSGELEQLNAVAYSGSLFAAVGTAGLLITSPDGTTWTVGTTGPENTLYSVGWDGSKFIGGGWYLWAYNCYGTIVESTDGSSWGLKYDGTSKEVIFGISGSIAVGKGGKWYRDSESTWSSNGSGVTASLNGICTDGSELVAVGSGGSILRSVDTLLWTPEQSGTTKELKSVTVFKTSEIAVGASGTILVGTKGPTSVESVHSTKAVSSISYRIDHGNIVITGISGQSLHGTVVSLTGRVVAQFEGVGSAELSTANIANGCYILNCSMAGVTSSVKMRVP